MKTDEFVYRFCYSPGVTLERIKALLSSETKVDDQRVCYATTSHSRMYLWIIDGKLEMIPYEYQNNAWRKVHHHLWDMKDLPDNLLESEKTLADFLFYSMARQFRNTVMGYYEELPSQSDILANLVEGDTAAVLRQLRYTFYETEVEEDPEWQGAIEVLCNEGLLVIPYTSDTECPENDEDRRLLVKYATYVPDNPLSAIGGGFARFKEKVSYLFMRFGWTSFRDKVNGGNS